ncbi:MAG: elongation factor P [Synergistaceae bacterium]|nr:elongation factor P [Synergistaceae bacterium]
MAQVVDTSDFRPGLKIKWEGGMWIILECSHHKMGRGGAIVRSKLRNLETGSSVDQSFKSGERFERIIFDERPAQYQYKDGDSYVFMDMESYDQVYLTEDMLGDAVKYLIDDLEASFDMYEERVMGIELPTSVAMQITDTPPSFKGDTASGGGKPATTETGLVITVPFFVENGETVLVDTRTGEYLERAKKS